jgi:hypothetical protein
MDQVVEIKEEDGEIAITIYPTKTRVEIPLVLVQTEVPGDDGQLLTQIGSSTNYLEIDPVKYTIHHVRIVPVNKMKRTVILGEEDVLEEVREEIVNAFWQEWNAFKESQKKKKRGGKTRRSIKKRRKTSKQRR